jgi:uncharacterized membrane protein YozB (DUF420 family)
MTIILNSLSITVLFILLGNRLLRNLNVHLYKRSILTIRLYSLYLHLYILLVQLDLDLTVLYELSYNDL